MTKKELQAQVQYNDLVKKWNVKQSNTADESTKDYFILRDKYLKLDGFAECSETLFILQVAKCPHITENERNRDIRTIIEYHEGTGRYKALYDYLYKDCND